MNYRVIALLFIMLSSPLVAHEFVGLKKNAADLTSLDMASKLKLFVAREQAKQLSLAATASIAFTQELERCDNKFWGLQFYPLSEYIEQCKKNGAVRIADQWFGKDFQNINESLLTSKRNWMKAAFFLIGKESTTKKG